ncbi:MAG TPA: serine/threonine-protein kinase [Planctomycetia bacterium]|nr:serine/threonine-protein kinase [Planctomycetia bacterium]
MGSVLSDKPTVAITAPHALSAAELASEIGRCGLLEPKHQPALDLFAKQFTSAAVLADELVRRKIITSWQARNLLSGERHFFLGEYRLLDHIATGGMGAVYKAAHHVRGKIVAIKVTTPEVDADPIARERFIREVRVLTALDHPTIVKALGAVVEGEARYLVMEYVAGMDLWDRNRQLGPMPVPLVCECARQTLAGLEYARHFGVVHRDLKPSNLILADTGTSGAVLCKILDLGLAGFSGGTGPGLTNMGEFIGTADYAAPEQARNAWIADARSDIYGLGMSMYELIAGRLPKLAKTAMEGLLLRARQEVPSIESCGKPLPEGFAAVLTKMLARKPSERFQTPLETAKALSPFCGRFHNPAIK